jgi:hypothetical protein
VPIGHIEDLAHELEASIEISALCDPDPHGVSRFVYSLHHASIDRRPRGMQYDRRMPLADETVLAARVARAGERADRVVQFAHSMIKAVNSRAPISGDQLIVLNFLARGMSTLRAVRLLVDNGLAGDATSCMRTLVELDIDLAYILLKPALHLQRFYEYNFVVYARMIEENPGAVSKETAAAARARRDAVIKHYKDHKNRWTKASIRERADATSRKRPYRAAYALGCHASHSGMGTLGYAHASSNEDETSLMTATQRATAEPINFAAMALFRLIGSVAEYNSVECQAEADEVATVFDDAATEH